MGTGFVIGPNAVATAAHCVYNEDRGGYAKTVKVVPAKNRSIEPFGSETITSAADNLVVSSKYIENNGPEHDWAVIELETDIGNKTGWLGLKWQDASYNNTGVYNTGYPIEVNGKAVETRMYKGYGTIKVSATNLLKGTWDASAGNSGGPVYTIYEELGYTAIGILTSGSEEELDGQSYPTTYSTATRITKEMYNLFMQYR